MSFATSTPPIASATVLGLIKVGNGLTIDNTGVLSTASGYFSATLGAPTALGTGGTDLLSVGPLPAGTYEIRVQIQVTGGAGAATVEIYIWDLTTVYGAIRLVTTAAFPSPATLIVPVTLAAPAPIHLGASATTPTTANAGNGGAVHPGQATYLTAQRVA